MKVLWISPWGDGWAMAAKIRDAGNKVVYYCPDPHNKNGLGLLPRASEATWENLANKSDLVICDGVFPSHKTRRSWHPSDMVQRLTQLRKRGVPFVGPTPTTELITNDERYRQKILTRFALGSSFTSPKESAGLKACLSVAPGGSCYLVIRHRNTWAVGNGPEIGNLGDVVIPLNLQSDLVKRFNKLMEFLQGVQHTSYSNFSLTISETNIEINDCSLGFLYPAIFAQLPDLLSLIFGSNPPTPEVRLAVSLLDGHANPDTSADHLLDHDGFFGGEIHKSPETGKIVSHGEFLGAVAGTGRWPLVQNKVNDHLQSLLREGWGFRPNIGDTANHILAYLQTYRWI